MPQRPPHPELTSRNSVCPVGRKLLIDDTEANFERLKNSHHTGANQPKKERTIKQPRNFLLPFCLSAQWVEFGPCKSVKGPAKVAMTVLHWESVWCLCGWKNSPDVH